MIPVKKIYFYSGIFTVISILLTVFIIYPFFQQIKRNSKDYLAEKSNLIFLEKEKESFEKMKAFYKTNEDNLKKIENVFVNPDVPIEFINFLEKNGSDSQIQIEISAMDKKKEKDDYWPSLYLKLLTAGSFSNIMRFLEKIENGPYLIEVIEFNFKKFGQEKGAFKEFINLQPAEAEASLLIKAFTK